MNSQLAKIISKRDNRASIICTMLAGAYFAMLFRYGMNVPLWDDYYDLLYFLYTYLQADSLDGKIASLFWQFTEHRNPVGRLVYLADFYLFGHAVDFFRLCLLGAVFLAALAWLVGQLAQHCPRRLNGGHVIAFALLFSMSMWQGSFWAMNATSVILFAVMCLSVFLLLRQHSVATLVLAMLIMAALVTMGLAGAIVLVFACFYGVAGPRSRRHKNIWLLFCLLAAALLAFSYHDYLQLVEYSREDTLSAILANPLNFLLTAFGFVGGLPFADGDSLWPGAALGLLLILASALLLRVYWRVDRQQCYMLLALFGWLYTLMLAACVGRFLYMGEYIAYAPRFKQYPAMLTALLLISSRQLYPHVLARYGTMVLALLMTVNGYVRFLPEVIRQAGEIQEKITRWSAEGTHKSLGMVGIAPHAEQILFWAIDNGLYDPYRTARAIRHRHRAPEPLSQCVDQPAVSLDAFVLNRPYSLGARVMLHGRDDALDIHTLYLCSPTANYRLDATDPGSELSIQTALLAPGDYRLFFTAGGGEYRGIHQTLTVAGPREKQACDTADNGLTVSFSREVRRVFCPLDGA